jgi:hypothetical protein
MTPRHHRRSRRHETVQSDLGLSTNRSTDRIGLPHSHQQGRGAAHARRAVPSGTRFRRAVLAHGPRSLEGQSVESRFVSMRIGRPVHTLGARRDGPMHASHRGLWRASRRSGWRGAVPDVDQATRGQSSPKYVSSDHDSLYRFHQCQANLRILNVKEIKTVPYVPLSHPFVERLIGTIRRECLDRTLFWTAADLEMKLLDFQRYYNGHRTHAGLEGRLPEPSAGGTVTPTGLGSYRWRRHCRGLYQTPIAA